jgi:hypothetical protein
LKLDDNYLDQIFTKMSAEHRDLLMSTAKRLNLPDDDALFVFIGAAEYILELTQNVLVKIESQNGLFEESSDKSATDLSAIGKVIVADIKNVGSANISAIAQANQESMHNSKAIAERFEVVAIEIGTVLDNLKALSEQRETALVESVRDILASSYQANKYTEDLTEELSKVVEILDESALNLGRAATQIERVHENVIWEKWLEWLSPSLGLLLCGLIGLGIGTGAMYFRYENELAYKWGKYIWGRNAADIVTCINNKAKICRLRIRE